MPAQPLDPGIGYAAYSAHNFGGKPGFDIVRGYLPFDTSSIPSDAVISGARLGLWVVGVENSAGGALCLVQSHQAAGDQLTTDDYFMPEGTKELAERILLADLEIGAYNTFEFNAAGLAWINPVGHTFLACRTSHDQDDVEPADGTAAGVRIAFSGHPDPDKRPRLSVDFTG